MRLYSEDTVKKIVRGVLIELLKDKEYEPMLYTRMCDKIKDYPTEINWHTGTPTKDDWYFVMWKDTEDNWNRFSALMWNNSNKTWYDDVTPDENWGDEYHAEVIAWMLIPDFKEKN